MLDLSPEQGEEAEVDPEEGGGDHTPEVDQGAIRGGGLAPGLEAQGETKIVQGQDLVENPGISPDPGVVQHPNQDQDHCIIQNLEIGQGPSLGIDLNL